MPKNIQFVQIEAGEDAASVRDRLSFMRGQNVLLVWPEEGTALSRKLDLVLVQREAMRRAIRIALVTHDMDVMQHARELNISSFETIGASQRATWKRARTKVFANRWQKPEGEREPSELMSVASRVRSASGRALPRLVRLTLVGLVILAAAVLAYLLIPSAEVTLRIPVERIRVDAQITADLEALTVDITQGVIPARVQPVEIQETGQRSVTGAVDLPDTFASGTVVFVNLSQDPIDIPVGTVVRTSAAEPFVRFLTTAPATLSGSDSARVEVPVEAAAESSGAVGNVGMGLVNAIEADWAADVTVSNLSAMSGGETRSLPSVTQSDLDALRGTVRQQLFTRALTELETYLSPTEFVIEETLTISDEREDWLDYSAAVGDFAETVDLTMRAVVEAVVVDSSQGQRIAFAEIGRQIRGRLLKPETLNYTRGAVTSVDAAGRVTFILMGEVDVISDVNRAALAAQLAGLSVSDAEQHILETINLADGGPAQITLNSPWGEQMPLLAARISVRVVEVPLP